MNALININITETEDERQVNISTYDGKKGPMDASEIIRRLLIVLFENFGINMMEGEEDDD